ncbi:MAG: hypothetical protein Q9M89_00580 [Persephonella sp.]|nr:hypothetical protein [Persephonella sp.]
MEEKDIPVSVLKEQPVIREVVQSKYQETDYKELIKKVSQVYQNLIVSYGE